MGSVLPFAVVSYGSVTYLRSTGLRLFRTVLSYQTVHCFSQTRVLVVFAVLLYQYDEGCKESVSYIGDFTILVI